MLVPLQVAERGEPEEGKSRTVHEPEPGVESYGRLPSGRWAKIVWRYNGWGDEHLIFVITAYRVPHGPSG